MHRGFCITVLRRAVDCITKTMLSEYDLVILSCRFCLVGNLALLLLFFGEGVGVGGWGGGRNCGWGWGRGVLLLLFTVTLASIHQRFKVNEHV